MEADTMTASRLRNSMASRLCTWDGAAVPAAVESAMRAVPREAFLPGTPLAAAYGSGPVVTHRDEHSVATSSASAPGIVAAMLAQLDVCRGHRILEIGAGTGYNAALLASLTGPAGQVTTVELDPGVAAEAVQALSAAGYGNVTVIVGDGEYGYAPNAPYDRIIVTAGAWELPAAWASQLAPGGLLVVPLRMRGLTRSVAFEHIAGAWRSRSMHECGFMPIRGAGAVTERNIPLGDTGITIRIDDGQQADAEALQRALSSGPAQAWTGVNVTVTGELDFWLAGLGGFFRLLAGSDAAQRAGILAPAFSWGAMGLLSRDSFSYLIRRPGRPGRSELGACGYGPRREQLISAYADRIHAFSRAQAGSLQLEVRPLTHAPPRCPHADREAQLARHRPDRRPSQPGDPRSGQLAASSYGAFPRRERHAYQRAIPSATGELATRTDASAVRHRSASVASTASPTVSASAGFIASSPIRQSSGPVTDLGARAREILRADAGRDDAGR